MTKTYAIHPSNLPKGAESCILWALNEWQAATGNRIRFTPSRKAEIIFSGSKPPDNKAAFCYSLGNNVFSIVFDPALPWSTTWWHRFLGRIPDFRTLALHEIGHALGLSHSSHTSSIMHPRPTVSYVDDVSAASV